MQPDLENLGGIAGLAAVYALNCEVKPRNINVKEFQKQLVEYNLLPSSILERTIEKYIYNDNEIEDLISKFNPDMSLNSYSDMEMGEIWTEKIPIVEVCTSPPEIAIPLLEKALSTASGRKAIRLAQALAMFGAESAAKTIHDEIISQLTTYGLPQLMENIKWSGVPPDQAAMPLCANLIYSLGMTRSKLNLPVWEKVADIFKPTSLKDFYSKKMGLFYYVDAVCYGAEILGSSDAIPALKKLHGSEFLNTQSLKKGIEKEYVLERVALLELNIGRALARSGSVDGLQILIEYLDDMRGILAEFAHTTLIKVTGTHLIKNKSAWKNWIISNQSMFKPVPIVERADG
jgi:hypothetical protein